MAENHGRGRWFSFFQAAGFIFCFLIFPVFVLNSSLMSLFELRLTSHSEQIFSELSQQLNQLEPFNDERRYFHLLLQRVFNFSERSTDSTGYLARAIARLKKNHPGRLEFVVWDKSGAIVDKLTDEKRFRYVMKKLWEVMHAVREHVLSSNPTPLRNLPAVKSNLSLIRQFLGRVFLPETLVTPWLPGEEASLILADYGKTRPYFWYHVGRNGGMLVFLSWDAINDSRGLQGVVRSMNRANPAITIGFADLNNLTEPYLCRNQHLRNDVVMALARFENSSESMIETDRTQIVIQMLSSSSRAFAVHRKDESASALDRQRCRLITQAVVVYLLGLVILYFMLMVRRPFFSIRWKLLFLFLYANVAPLGVLAAISYDYLQNKEISLRNDVLLEMARKLREIDTRYQTQSEDFSAHLNALLSRINLENRGSVLSDAMFAMLKRSVYALSPSETFLVDHNDQMIFALDEHGKTVKYSNTYIRNLASSILQFHNRVIVEHRPGDVLSRISSPEESDFVRDSIRESGKIWPMSVGDTTKLAYWNMLGEPESYRNNYILLLLWDELKFQQMFLQSHQQSLLSEKGLIRIYAGTGDGRKIFPEVVSGREVLERFLRATGKSEGNVSSQLTFAEAEYIACGVRGRNMNRTSFAALYPVAMLDAEIAALRRNMLGGAAISLMVTLMIGLAVAQQFLVPVRALEQAGKAIYHHQFKHRIQIADRDEFGRLGQVMNRVIEGLGELEIARIVQESLFPEEVLRVSSLSVYGKSQTTTTLGGDYFDYFSIDEHHCGVIIGEIVGKGIVAALIIAMVKAGVKMAATTELLDPSVLTRKLHRVILGLQRPGLDYLVTFQYMVFDQRSGLVKMVNAGHCFPILINHLHQTAAAIEQVAFPLGVMQSPCYQNLEFTIADGETLILYTDGAYAAKDIAGEALPCNMLAESALQNFANDPEQFCNILLAATQASTGKLIDDTTFVVINCQESSHG